MTATATDALHAEVCVDNLVQLSGKASIARNGVRDVSAHVHCLSLRLGPVGSGFGAHGMRKAHNHRVSPQIAVPSSIPKYIWSFESRSI